MEMNCSMCGAPFVDGEPHCSKCKGSMSCTADMCTCANCGNKVMAEEIKCDVCLEM